MKSPFPGMDPYLERYWLSFHNRLVTYVGDELNARLPEDLRAEMTERVLVSSAHEDYRRRILPDVYIGRRPGTASVRVPVEAAHDTGGVAVAEPIVVRFPDERAIETAVRIVDLDGGTLITAIELLSASNKFPGPDRESYLRKRDDYLSGGVNLVEIDLFRPGDRTLEGIDAVLPADSASPYLIIMKRGDRPADEWEIVSLPLRQRLPAVRLPLRPSDPDVLLDLQPMIDRAYANGRYPIDYRRDPEPPLAGEDAAWAAELLGRAGLR